MVAALDLFDELAEPDQMDQIDDLKKDISKIVERMQVRKSKKNIILSALQGLVKAEVAKLAPPKIIERQIEQVIKHEQIPVYLEPKIVKEKAAPPQIIKETRVEVQVEKKDTNVYAHQKTVDALEKKISDIESALQRTHEVMGSLGGSGVIGIPAPEGNNSKVLTVSGNRAIWSAPTTFYLGDPNSEGSWRFLISGNELLVQTLVSGTWTTEGAYTR